MEIVVGKLSGFCNGVAYTVIKANEALEENETIYCLGQIVHNERVIKELEDKGMITVNSIEEVPNKSKVIIRAHGEVKETYEKAKEKEIEVIDLTCGKIKIIRNKIEKESSSFIIIIGKKNHPETLGIKSFSKNNSIIIENEEDINDIPNIEEKSVFIVSQTTFNSEKFDYLVKLIKEKINKEIKVDKTICDATSNRQKETEELSKNVDTMIIVGGKNSSNTKELEVVSTGNCEKVYLIQDYNDLKEIKINKKDKIGIMAGASTPKVVVDEIIKYLEELK